MEDEENTVTTDPSRLLMSDTLRGVLQDEVPAPNEAELLAANYVIVVLAKVMNGESTAVVGTLEGITIDSGLLEVELKVQFDDALELVQSTSEIVMKSVELHNGDALHQFPGPFTIKAARLGLIDYRRRMCVLLLNMREAA